MLKILLLKNNIIDNDTLQKGITLVKQYASTIGLTLDFTQVDTPKQFTSVPFINGMDTGSGYQITPQEVFDEAKRLGYVFSPDNIAVVVFDSTKIIPNPTNPIDNGVIIQIPQNWYGADNLSLTTEEKTRAFCLYFFHELCHYDAVLNNVPDLTHKQFDTQWNGQFNQKSNIDYYLFLLKRFIVNQPVTTPIVTLHRFSDDGIQALGDLTYGTFSCKTLERPWKNNERNISCIPKGTYNVKWSYSWKFMKYTYEILNVPNRSGIRIHSANYFFDLLGCITLGTGYSDLNHDAWADIINSKITVNKLENLLKKQPFTLIIN